MNHARIALALSLAGFLVMPQPSSAEDSPRQLPVLVHMQAALDVDRDGNVTAVTFVDDDDRQVPDAIRQRGEQVAKAWKFVPPTKAGKAVGGRTYAGMNACIVPAEGGLEFTVAYTGNGPGTFYRPSRKPRSHGMPIGRLADQGINRLGGTIVYVVSVDGKARLETATLDDPELQRQYGERWQRDQREDQKNFRYRPELIDGVPIATRVETTVEQVWFATGDRKAAARMAADNQESAERSDACQALRGQEDRQIASDSPFKRIGG